MSSAKYRAKIGGGYITSPASEIPSWTTGHYERQRLVGRAGQPDYNRPSSEEFLGEVGAVVSSF